LYALTDTLSQEGTDDIDALIEPYLDSIYSGEWDMEQVLMEIYLHNAAALLDSYENGYGKSYFSPDWSVRDNNLLKRVQNNIFAFSGAKTYAEMNELRDAVYENGRLLSAGDFRRRARKINARYNVRYLETERHQVMAAGTQGSRWLDFEETADTHPYLEYVTARDEHVREEHRRLDGLVYPIDDEFWRSYYPPNGWRCRCSVRKLTEREYSRKVDSYRERNREPLPDSETGQRMAGKVVAKPFRHNVGTSEIFERDGHPYFKAHEGAREMQLSAVKNYGMKPVKEIYTNTRKLSRYENGIHSEEDYREHWEALEQKYGAPGEGFTLVDRKNNIYAHFDRSLMNKIVEKERAGYFDEVERIIFQPDEVWGTYKNSNNRSFKEELFNAYIRYYEDKPVVLLINNEGRVDSFYKLYSIEQCEEFRSGLLKKKR
jgi:SPP1 gp7 family putative phage head morphogenesis protein